MFGLKWQVLAGAFLAGLLALSTAAGVGFYYGHKNAKAEYEKEQVSLFKQAVDTAMKISDEFAKIGRDLAKGLEANRQDARIIYVRQTENAQENPLPDNCIVSDTAIRLRNEQIEKVNRAISGDVR